MFSVGARPFNSRPRQIYGGWTLEGAGDNMWAKKQFYEMSAKYNPDAEARADARTWLRMYKERAKGNKAFQKMVREAGKPYWSKAVMPALPKEQRDALWESFRTLPLSEAVPFQVTSKLLRSAPHPNWKFMQAFPNYGAPLVADADANKVWNDYAATFMGAFRNVDDLGFNRRLAAARARRAKFTRDFDGMPVKAEDEEEDAMG